MAERTDTLLAWIPDDIVRIREERPASAHNWRHAVRRPSAARSGTAIGREAITRDGWLLLAR